MNYCLPNQNLDWLIVSITPKHIVYSFSRTGQLILKTSKAAVDGLICFQFASVFCRLLTDTVNVTLQITRTKVPSSDTTYVCQVFDLPSDKPYHMFGTKPIIDNPYVMHHTIMYGCTDDVGEWAKLLTIWVAYFAVTCILIDVLGRPVLYMNFVMLTNC